MPRVANESPKVAEWNRKTGEGSSTFDLCSHCYEDFLGEAPSSLDLQLYKPGEPEGVLAGGVEHPPFEDHEYNCEVCGARLTEDDN